uniref:Uncharacterized protein n=1 Tax=Anabas testudineus TaxID=64144 RepID=A0A3Q1JV49_ANATE
TQLCVGALQAGLLALTAQRVLFDELVARAAMQTELQATIVLRKVAAHTPDDDGSADVAGLYLHLPAHSRTTSLYDGQAAALAAAILSSGLVHFLICTAMVGLEDHSTLQVYIRFNRQDALQRLLNVGAEIPDAIGAMDYCFTLFSNR